ncbi:GNAT family N-acetyltransferase [Salipiger mucosus]|uniref:Phosphinothricin N-acetyltransferase n=1 Tax=Salipiger mucosus DSM 16094 TaxID=1123237 RepID=S9QUX3_9RHOB|nr:GNAT family N-acetyltransferase [Salipiger mucosus]EPX85171.1 phosphinothricin N-acetyltransferase [Salipiger mucosus DSM 16094]
MILRPAREADAEAIAAIWNPLIEGTAVTFTTAPKTPEGLRADIAARGAAFQVAEEGGALLGFATYFQFRGGPGYARTMEHSVQLAPEARGRGIGRALMAALEAEARAQGVHSMFAGVSGENPAGRAFHAALGYREVARLPEVGHKFGRWMDLLLMQKILGMSH